MENKGKLIQIFLLKFDKMHIFYDCTMCGVKDNWGVADQCYLFCRFLSQGITLIEYAYRYLSQVTPFVKLDVLVYPRL